MRVNIEIFPGRKKVKLCPSSPHSSLQEIRSRGKLIWWKNMQQAHTSFEVLKISWLYFFIRSQVNDFKGPWLPKSCSKISFNSQKAVIPKKMKRQDAKRNYADNGTAMGSRKSVPTFPSSNALGEGAFGMQPQTWQAQSLTWPPLLNHSSASEGQSKE